MFQISRKVEICQVVKTGVWGKLLESALPDIEGISELGGKFQLLCGICASKKNELKKRNEKQ